MGFYGTFLYSDMNTSFLFFITQSEYIDEMRCNTVSVKRSFGYGSSGLWAFIPYDTKRSYVR